MGRKRNEKILAIIALCVAVVGLTLGFATFSNTLTIESSAEIIPDGSQFKIRILGLPQIQDYDDFHFDDPQSMDKSKFESTTKLSPLLEFDYSVHATATVGEIDNENLTIKNLTAQFKAPDSSIDYVFVIENVGKYDAYYNLMNFKIPSRVCTAGDETSEALVAEACKGINMDFGVGYLNENTSTIDWDITKIMDQNGNIKLAVGKHWYMRITIQYEYDAARADGPFDVKWDDFEFNFKTNAT